MLGHRGLLETFHMWVTSSKRIRQVKYRQACTLVFTQGPMDNGILCQTLKNCAYMG
jgi:hypothetical protein